MKAEALHPPPLLLLLLLLVLLHPAVVVVVVVLHPAAVLLLLLVLLHPAVVLLLLARHPRAKRGRARPPLGRRSFAASLRRRRSPGLRGLAPQRSSGHKPSLL